MAITSRTASGATPNRSAARWHVGVATAPLAWLLVVLVVLAFLALVALPSIGLTT